MLKLRKILLCSYIYYVLLLISLLYTFIYIKTYVPQKIYNINENIFYTEITSIKIDGDKLTINLKGKEKLLGTYYFESEEEKLKFNYNYKLGDYIKITGNLKEPVNNTIPNSFNYKKYLTYKGINYILSIESYEKLKSNKNIFLKLKNYMYDIIYNISDNEYLYAFILGNGSYIDSEYYNSYRINGITHLFALSGSQVILISDVLSLIFRKIKLNEKLSFIITSFFVILFTFIASFAPSLLRATIFFILVSLNKIYYTFIKSKYLLYITFIIMILYNPFYVYDLGFLLSFTITFFLIIIGENVKFKKKFNSSVFTSLISFLASAPILINNFYEVNSLGFVNNLFFIPYVTYIVFPLSVFTFVFKWLSPVLKAFTDIMERVSYFSSDLLSFNVYFVKMSLLIIILYYLLLILIIRYKKNILKLLFILLIIISYIKPLSDKNTYVYFLDVSQGDSILIKTKNNKSIMIDTGGKIEYEKESWQIRNNNFNLMENTIIPFIKSNGIKRINYLILTHGDYDHMGEAINLVENFKVEKVILNCGEFNELEQELIKVLDKKKIPYYSCINELNIDDNKLYFLNNKDYGNENDNSNVIYFNNNNYKFLFMGDAGVEVEQDLIEKYNLKDIDVLKVGHHGSKTSSSKNFIDDINPKYSIISVGKNNRYGHPNKEVLNTLTDSMLYRTDQNGSIMFKIYKNKLQVETCIP